MKSGNIIGQTLDEKYKIESEIGKGGMGTVYLATHVGTERPVAVKVIAPQFMQRVEFVERFKREARAAGRLRHPNVVDVTDFGFANITEGSVAYLVMEYLDGCTLGEILEEEEKLPLEWTLDILEQVCSAVQEAHQQGIIHRDLKPDNIWLEPNQRGGYTVKVLDFGIAKLEEAMPLDSAKMPFASSSARTSDFPPKLTIAENSQSDTISENRFSTVALETATAVFSENSKAYDAEVGTLIQEPVDSEGSTAIFPAGNGAPVSEDAGTKLMSAQVETDKSQIETAGASNLTRAGSVLGTPLYMSPEQCRGEKLTPQSDIYSLGVIAYQMLSGKTPFDGNFTDVMNAHKEIEPPKLEAKKVPKKVKNVINFALSKNPEDRPPSAQSFAAELRAQSEGIGILMQRALVIYGAHLPKFLLLSILLYVPIAIITFLQVTTGFLEISGTINHSTHTTFKIILALLAGFFGFFCGYMIFGTTTWLVAQILAMPLRPVKLRPALKVTKKRWKTFAGTGIFSAIFTLAGYALCFVPGMVLSVLWALVAPVVMMEGLRGVSALRRSKALVKRSLRTTTAAAFIMFFAPLIISVLITLFVSGIVKSFSSETPAAAANEKVVNTETGAAADTPAESAQINIKVGSETITANDKKKPKDTAKQIRAAIRDVLTQVFLLPITIIVSSFSSIIIALLYMKTRQIGGESTKDLLAQFEETDQPQTNWQKRVHQKLIQSGKLTGKSRIE